MTELLSVIVGGTYQVEIAKELVRRFQTYAQLEMATIAEITAIKGIGRAVALRIKAALEVGWRRVREQVGDSPKIMAPISAADVARSHIGSPEREEMGVILLDTKNQAKEVITIYRGTVNTTSIRIAELFQDAVKQCSSAIILFHNHPSGRVVPSREDIEVTKLVVKAGKILSVEVLDHIILGGHERFTSLKEGGFM